MKKLKCKLTSVEFILVLLGSMNIFLTMPFILTLPIFVPSWLEEFNETRTKTVMIPSLCMGVMCISGVVNGLIIDRFGLRITLVAGSLLICAGFIGTSFATSIVIIAICTGALAGFGIGLVYLGTIVSVSKCFTHNAGVAIGTLSAAGTLGFTISPFITSKFMDLFGWRGAIFMLAGIELHVLPIGYLLTTLVRQHSQKNNNYKKSQISLKNKLKALASPQYFTTLLSTLIVFLAANSFLTVISDISERSDMAIYFLIASSTAVVSGIGCPLLCKHIPRLQPSWLYFLVITMMGINMILVPFSRVLALSAGGYGSCMGGIGSLLNVVILDMVGKEIFPIGSGICLTARGIGAVLSGVIYGAIYDKTKSYTIAFVTLGSLAVAMATVSVICRVHILMNELKSGFEDKGIEMDLHKEIQLPEIEALVDTVKTDDKNNLPT